MRLIATLTLVISLLTVGEVSVKFGYVRIIGVNSK